MLASSFACMVSHYFMLTPDTREWDTLPNSLAHVRNLVLGVLRSWMESVLLTTSISLNLRKYMSVLPGRTKALALIPFIAAPKSPLYGS